MSSFLNPSSGGNPLRNPDFRRLWLSNTLGNFGAQITLLALPTCATLQLHASTQEMGTLVALETLPFLLLGLPTGVMLDRRRRLPVLWCSHTMIAMALASVPLASKLNLLSIEWLYAVAFSIGTGYMIGGAAELVFMTSIIGRDNLCEAQAKFASTESAARLVGPGLAGLLVQLLGAPLAVLFNAGGSTLSLLNLNRIRSSEPEPERKDSHPCRAMIDGLAFVSRHPLLRKLTLISGGWHLLFYGCTALQVVYALRVLGLNAGVMGMAQMLGGSGGLLGSLLVKRATDRFGAGPVLLAGQFASALGWTLMPAIPASSAGGVTATAAYYGVTMFLVDLGATLFLIPYGALRQQVTPDPVLGRTIATMRCLTVAMAPLGALIAGALAEFFSIRIALACIGAAAIAMVLIATLGGRLHHLQC